MTDTGIYDDDQEPKATYWSTTYVVANRKLGIRLYVEIDDRSEAERYVLNVISNGSKLLSDSSEIYEYLKEWELIELRKIGPEDSEWFATDKLTGVAHEKH